MPKSPCRESLLTAKEQYIFMMENLLVTTWDNRCYLLPNECKAHSITCEGFLPKVYPESKKKNHLDVTVSSQKTCQIEGHIKYLTRKNNLQFQNVGHRKDTFRFFKTKDMREKHGLS